MSTKTLFRLTVLVAALAITSVFADPSAGHCGHGAEAAGMQARMKTMHDQMDRIEWTEDRAKQRELMDLHMKHMQEGMRELRRRQIPSECRIELMGSMMESMMRHQQVQDQGGK